MGTTLTAAYILGNRLYLAHVGDSRAYLIRDGNAVCLSADHTTVGDMVRSKLLSPDKIRTHAQRSVLTKAIGVSLFVQPDITEHRLQEGDHLILCSDGVWSVIEDRDFARAVSDASSIEHISQQLVEWAIQNETDDNASVVAIHINKLATASAHSSAQDGKGNRWFQYLRKFVS
jgi:protein phosphatase